MSSRSIRFTNCNFTDWFDIIREHYQQLDQRRSERYEKEKKLAISISLNIGLIAGILMMVMLQLIG